MIRRLARPMLATVFVIDGVETLRHPQAHVATAAPLVDKATPLVEKGEQAVNEHVTTQVPPVSKDTEMWVKGLAGVKVGAGVLFALGKAPRLSALALTASHVPSTVVRNAFWAESDKAARSRKTTGFATDVALLGALLLATVDTAGQPGLAWRARKTADKVSAKLPGAKTESAAAGAAIAGVAHNVADQAREVGDTVREKAPEVAETVRTRAPEVAGQVRGQAWGLADKVLEKAPKVAEQVRSRAAAAREQAAPVAAHLRDQAATVAGAAAEQAADLGETARHGAETARAAAAERAGEVDTDKARKKAAKVRKDATRTARSTRKDVEKAARSTRKDVEKSAKRNTARAKKETDRLRAKAAGVIAP